MSKITQLINVSAGEMHPFPVLGSDHDRPGPALAEVGTREAQADAPG